MWEKHLQRTQMESHRLREGQKLPGLSKNRTTLFGAFAERLPRIPLLVGTERSGFLVNEWWSFSLKNPIKSRCEDHDHNYDQTVG